MGLSFYYSGRFNPAMALPDLIEEVRDIASIYNWKYFVFEENFITQHIGTEKYHNENIYGICFSPPECEPVWLSFLSNGRMSSPPNLQLWSNPDNPEYKDYLYMLDTKTQFAGPEIHIVVIEILRHLSKKYLLDFKLTDDGEYWETGDKEILLAVFERYNFLLNGFSNLLQNSEKLPDEDIETYIIRLANKLHNKGKT